MHLHLIKQVLHNCYQYQNIQPDFPLVQNSITPLLLNIRTEGPAVVLLQQDRCCFHRSQ